MLLAQIAYLVIDVSKSIVGESCISVDMIEKYIKSSFFFLKQTMTKINSVCKILV